MLLNSLFGDGFDITTIIIYAIAILLVFPIHESAHAFVAHLLGDDTGRLAGRISLNPFAHLDLYGTIMMLVVGVGYAKPVPINPNNFKNRKVGMAVSALAGPVSNLLLAFVLLIIGKLIFWIDPLSQSSISAQISTLIYQVAFISTLLAVFNLIPIPPLDGSRIATVFLPERIYFKIMQYEHYILIGFFALILIDGYKFHIIDSMLSFLSGGIMQGFDWATGFIDTIGFNLFMK